MIGKSTSLRDGSSNGARIGSRWPQDRPKRWYRISECHLLARWQSQRGLYMQASGL